MSVSPDDPALFARFDALARACEASLDNFGGTWTVIIRRDGHTPIRCAHPTLPTAVAEAIGRAEALGWHAPSDPT